MLLYASLGPFGGIDSGFKMDFIVPGPYGTDNGVEFHLSRELALFLLV